MLCARHVGYVLHGALPAAATEPNTPNTSMSLRPEPGFLDSLDAMERSWQQLRFIGDLVPAPQAPPSAMLEEWLEPYREWNVPQPYLDFMARYSGGSTNVPSVRLGLRPLSAVVRFRQRFGAAEKDLFKVRQIPLSGGHMEGTLRLVFPDEDVSRGSREGTGPPRVAFMDYADKVEYQADSFAMFLWHSVFLHAALRRPTYFESTVLHGFSSDELEEYNLEVGQALEKGGFEVFAYDSRVLCGQRGNTLFATTPRPTGLDLWVAREDDYHSMMEDRADIVAVMEATRQ